MHLYHSSQCIEDKKLPVNVDSFFLDDLKKIVDEIIILRFVSCICLKQELRVDV